MAEVTIMVLKVDLGCHRCYRKIKKLLCKYPEIRDQTFIEKEDTVMIKVVCCSPERIRQKLICKGGKTIKSIEIKLPPKPPPEKPKPPPEKPKEPEKPKPPPEKPKEPEKPKPPPEKPKEPEKPKPPPEKPKDPEKPKPPPPEKPKEAEKPKLADPPKEKPPAQAPAPAPAPAAAPVPGYPQVQLFPVPVCCKPCYDLGHGGPCHHGYGTPYQPPSSYDGYVRLVPSYDEPSGNWPSGCRCNRSYGCRCEFFTEENPACTIM